MFPFLKPRFFTQYREAGFIVGKFTVSNSGATFTPVTSAYAGSPESHPSLSCAGDTGQYVLTLSGGARQLTVVSLHCSNVDLDDPSEAFMLVVDEETGIDVTAGTIPFTAIGLGATPTIADISDGSIVTACLYVAR